VQTERNTKENVVFIFIAWSAAHLLTMRKGNAKARDKQNKHIRK